MNPYISIITTSFNCEKYIEHTIQSVYRQDSSNYKHIIIDGGSTDGTIAVLERYKNRFAQLVIEPDEGMYHGIDKGSKYVDTEIMAWLNADDIYYPWTFSVVEEIFKTYPEVDWIIGLPTYINQKGQCIKIASNAGTAYPRHYIKNGWFQPLYAGHLQQESMFWRKSLWDKVGGMDLTLKYAADFELWTRFAQYVDLYSVTIPLAGFRKRSEEQTSIVNADKYTEEMVKVCNKLKPPSSFWTYFSLKSNYFRIISRLFIWKTAKLITYSTNDSKWVVREMLRPLTKYSFSEILLEKGMRSNKTVFKHHGEL